MLARVLAVVLLLLCCLSASASPQREVNCMLTTVYGEARGEPALGQALVAQTILNRVTDRRWPNTVCGVVGQRRQFDGYRPLQRLTGPALRTYARLANVTANVWNGRTRLGRCGRATHFHSTSVRPAWARSMRRLCQVGNHIFYEATWPSSRR